MKKLLLIDGNAILHRAYHALPPLTNNKGEPVQAVYGFFSMLLNVLIDQKPEYLVICFDSAAPNFRQQMFASYQQHRPSASDDFISQSILLRELLERLGVAVFALDGYEADDLIGTIAVLAVSGGSLSLADDARKGSSKIGSNTRSLNENRQKTTNQKHHSSESVFNSSASDKSAPLEVVILTGDRDMLQLVNGQVKVLMPLVGITKTALMGASEVEEKYGVKTSQFVDYKALVGDASDGYPGVTGIGPKTASNLLKEYGTFENLYKNINKLPEKVGLKLATDAEQAALAKKLAKIETEAPIQFDMEKCKCADFDFNSLLAAFREQGFKTLTARWEKEFSSAKAEREDKAENAKKEKDEEQMGLF